MAKGNDPATDICYSLPRLVTMAIQCSFCTYFWELYTIDFGWTMAEWGIVQTLYSKTQTGSFLIFGIIFLAIDLAIQVPPGALEAEKKQIADEKLNISKGILMTGTFFHWLTYLLLILLPIRWHDIKTPFAESVLGKTSKFWSLLFGGPIALSTIVTSWGWWFFFGIPWSFIKLFWMITYPFMRLSWILIMNFTTIVSCLFFPFKILWYIISSPYQIPKYIAHKRKSGSLYIPPYKWASCLSKPKSKLVNLSQLPSRRINVGGHTDLTARETLKQLLPNPDPEQILDVPTDTAPDVEPTCILCFNNRLCNALLRRIKTKRFCVYFLTVANGVGVSAHELSNKALLTYIYKDIPKIGEATCVNLSFFFISNIAIILVFSLVKLYVKSKAAFSETFLIFAIFYLVLQIPILIGFYFGTKNQQPEAALSGTDKPRWEKWVCLVFKWFCLTTFHSAVVFLIFSCGPLINYVAIFIMGGKTSIGVWGVLVFLGSLNCTSWLFMIVTSIAGGDIGSDTVQMLLMGVCILGQSAVYFILTSCNYLLLILTGIVNSIFVTYTNIMLDITLGGNIGKWVFYGGFYAGTNFAISRAMPIMFNAFGKDDTIKVVWKCVRFDFQHCFPTVYKAIALVFIVANVVMYYIYGIAHRFIKYLDAKDKRQGLLDKLTAAATKFEKSANDFEKDAKDFHNKATSGSLGVSGTNLQTAIQKFKDVAAALGNTSSGAAAKFKLLATEKLPSLLKVCKPVLKCQVIAFRAKAKDFRDKANAFKNANGGTANDKTNFQAAAKAFSEAADKFKEIGETIYAVVSTFSNDLTSKALAFKDAASTFAEAAADFKNKANDDTSGKVIEEAQLGNIKGRFQQAANYFGNAASDFYEMIILAIQ